MNVGNTSMQLSISNSHSTAPEELHSFLQVIR